MTELPYSWTEDVLSPLGETGVMIRCGDTISELVHRRVMSVCALLERANYRVSWSGYLHLHRSPYSMIR